MTTKNHRHVGSLFSCAGVTTGFILCLLVDTVAEAQLTPAQINEFRNVVGDRVESAVILGGDSGVSGGAYNSVSSKDDSVNLNVSKFGGSGDIYPIRPLGDSGIGWQPQLQGNMGYLTAKNNFQAGSLLDGDNSEYKTFAVEFGGGARFWFNDNFSIAPTLVGMYGHTEESYTANSSFTQSLVPSAQKAGLIDWNADTWTITPALNVQYQYTWQRTILTLSSEPDYFHTESFSSSSPNVSVNGDSTTWENKIDVDTPLGVELFGHELRTGGFFSRTDVYGDLQDGLKTDYIYEAHGRIVLDFLGQWWKVQWIGVGVSYLWGSSFNGWSYGADVTFRF